MHVCVERVITQRPFIHTHVAAAGQLSHPALTEWNPTVLTLTWALTHTQTRTHTHKLSFHYYHTFSHINTRSLSLSLSGETFQHRDNSQPHHSYSEAMSQSPASLRPSPTYERAPCAARFTWAAFIIALDETMELLLLCAPHYSEDGLQPRRENRAFH